VADGTGVRPVLRRAVAAAGAACLTASAFCLASDTALRAAPLLAVNLRLPFAAPRLGLDAPAASPSPAPSAVPVAVAAPASPRPQRRSWLGRGPIVLKGDGTYQLGLNRSSRNGVGLAEDNYSSALSMVVERRTEQSAVSVSSAFGYGGGAFNAGSLIVGYRTPKYALSYGQVTGPSDSQLQIGGFARGVGLALPMRSGDLSLIAATATQPDQETYRVYGVRREWNGLGGFLSAAQYFAGSESGGGRQAITDFGYHRYGAKISTDTEVAVTSNHGVNGVADGAQLATAFHADLQGKTTGATIGLRYDPAGFQTLTGTLDAGFSGDLTLRRHSERFGDLDVDFGHTDTRLLGGSLEHDNRVTLSGGRTWTGFGIQYVGGLEGQHGDGGATLQRTGALTLTETVKGVSLFETYQASSVGSIVGNAGQRQLAIGASRPLLGGLAAYQFAQSSQSADASAGAGISQSLSYRRSIGKKLDAQITQTLQTTSNNGIRSSIADTAVSLVRRLSNVVAVQVSADTFRQSGLGGGSGTGFHASLVGPFGFGQPAQSTGRANPNLPAVIRGIVTYSSSATPFAYNAPTLHGYNNALVILDGRITQRTDASGEFEFRFVPPGAHTIRIDPATIQAGLISDREYQNVTVQGGQTTSIQFAVGNFAGVAGQVVATDANGKKRGLGGVGIAVDGIQAVTTAPDGHYSVGRLSPGAHTVEIVEATLPTSVAFVADKKKTVTVTPGTSTPLNFVATPLGSIAGNVVAPSDGGFGQLVGLKNVYVVAEPGEHAVITDDDGGFLLDNMPPGTYTLTIDADTIPDGLGVLSGPDGPVALEGGAALSGIIFKLGAAAKNVVYTFNDGKRQTIQVTTDPAIVPPGGLLRVQARSTAKDVKALVVESDVFGGFPLRLDPKLGMWTGTVVVPSLVKGDYALSVTAHRKDVTDASALVPVDPRIPLFAYRLSPRNPEAGHTVRVTLKSVAPVEEGDAVMFEDGYKIVLPKPTGHVFGFDIRLWHKGLPYSATVVTKRGQTYPLSLR
jgi:hypothetical protein